MLRLMLNITVDTNTRDRFFVEIPNYMLYRGYFHGVRTKRVENVDVDPKIEPDIKLIEWTERSNNDLFFVADTECSTVDRHIPYAISWCRLGKDDAMHTYIGKDCIDKFCSDFDALADHYIPKSLTKKSKKEQKKLVVYFHNLSYDGRMFANQNIIEIKMAQTRIIEMVVLLKGGNRLHLRDSYMLITSKLADFPQMFGTEEKAKKVFPYSFVKMEMFDARNTLVNLRDIEESQKNIWSKEDVEEFEETIKNDLGVTITKEKVVKNGKEVEISNAKINIELLVKNYVESDVRILSQGLTWFRNNMKNALGLDVTNYLSISAVAYDYFKKEAYHGENIYEYTGQVRDFIRQAVYGGRCMTRGNNAFKLNGVRLLDVDACSLYPSAMSIMNIPKGMPKKMENLDRYELERRLVVEGSEHIDAVIVRIKLKGIGTPLQFPLVCERNKKGIVMYENYVDAEMVVDDIQLMEMIKWQQIDYEILEGIYWNEGVSTKINEKIKDIYERRKAAKAQNPPHKIEQIYKMLMNSSYGKCIEMAKRGVL